MTEDEDPDADQDQAEDECCDATICTYIELSTTFGLNLDNGQWTMIKWVTEPLIAWIINPFSVLSFPFSLSPFFPSRASHRLRIYGLHAGVGR